MALIGSIIVSLQTKTADFTKGISKATSSIGGLASSALSFGPAIGAIGGALTAGAIASKLYELGASAFQAADDLGKAAANVGTSIEDLSGLQFAAKLGDIEFETLTKSLSKLNVGLAEAATTGKGKTAEALKTLGLSANELSGMNASEKIKAIAGAFKDIENPAQKAAIAQKLFGKSGIEMVGWLDMGADGIEKLMQESEALGFTLKDVDAAKINEANDAFDKLGFAMKGVGNALAVAVAPFVTRLTSDLLASGNAGQTASEYITSGLRMTVQGISVVLDVLDVFRDGWFLLNAAFQSAVTGIVTGLKYVAKGLDWVLEKLGLGASGAGEFFEAMEQNMADASKQAWDSFNENFAARTPGEELMGWFDSVAQAANNTADATNKAVTAIGEMAEAESKANEEAEKLVEKLTLQLATLGMSSTEAEIYKLAQDGANAATLEAARALQAQIDEQTQLQKAQEDATKRAEQLFEQTRTPFEKYMTDLEELEKLLASGNISTDVFNRAKDKLDKDLNENSGGSSVRFAEAAERGSASARSIINNQKFGGNDSMNKVASNTGDTAKYVKELRDIVKQRDTEEELSF